MIEPRPALQRQARIAGVLYLVIIVAALFVAIGVRGALIDFDDPAATAERILAAQPLYRLGLVADLVTVGCDIAVALLLYLLFQPVSRPVALLSAGFRLVAAAVTASASVCALFPLLAYGDGAALGAFTLDQRQTLALAALALREAGYAVSLLLFGVHCLLLGWLVFRSAMLPRALGLLLALAGLCYLVNSLAGLLAPAVADRLFPFILLPSLVAEVAFTGWLIVRGVRPLQPRSTP